MSELDGQHDKPGSETPDRPADTDSNQPSAGARLLHAGATAAVRAGALAIAYVTLTTATPASPDKSPEQPGFSKDTPHAIVSPAQKDRGSVIPAEDDGIDRREEAEKMTEGLTKNDKGKPI